MRVVNAYTISPNDIEQGDVMLFVVKAMVVGPGHYRLYRCEYTGSTAPDDIPQGSNIFNEEEVCEALFPSLALVAKPGEGGEVVTNGKFLNNALHAIDCVHEDQSIDLGTTVDHLEQIVAHARALVDAIQDDLERYPEG